MTSALIRFSPLYDHLIVSFEGQTFSIPWSQRDRLAQWLHACALHRPAESAQADAALPVALRAEMEATNDLLRPPARAVERDPRAKITSVSELLTELDL